MVLSDKGGLLARLRPLSGLGLGAALGDGEQYMSWIHIQDLARLILKAVRSKEMSGVYNAVAPNPVSNEEFMKKLEFISALKLRGSWGETGAQNIQPFSNVSLAQWGNTIDFQNNTTLLQTATPSSRLPNADVKWETTVETNAGFDMGLFGNQVNITFDWYNKKTKDLLLGNLPLPGYVGFSGPTVNLGTMENKGLEFQVDVRDILKSSELKIDVGANISTNKNQVVDIGYFDKNFGQGGYIGTNNGRSYPGQEWGVFYGYKFAGIFQSQQEIDDLNAAAKTRAAELGLNNSASAVYQSALTKPGDRKYQDINGTGNDGKLFMVFPMEKWMPATLSTLALLIQNLFTV
ncbi:MAG: TonB-dependent receptor [Bacteroidales bacterium]|nr:TonB-dependent receptor [Bacteroidales bacterium]